MPSLPRIGSFIESSGGAHLEHKVAGRYSSTQILYVEGQTIDAT